MEGNDSKPLKGHFDFFYQNEDRDHNEVLSLPSEPSDTEGDELVAALSHSANATATATARGQSPASTRKSSQSVNASMHPHASGPHAGGRRPSRADISLQQAKFAGAKGFSGYDSFGSISLEFVNNCGAVVLCCQHNHDGTNVACGLVNGQIKIYDISAHDNIHHLYTLADDIANLPAQGVTAVRYLSSPAAPNIVIAGYTSGHVKIWHTSSARALSTFDEHRETLNVAVDPLVSGSRLLTVGGTPDIFLYDMVTKQKVSTFAPSVELNVMDGHRSKVFACQFHPHDAHVFYTGGWDNTVQFWDTREPRAVRSLFGPHICGDSLDLDTDHNHLITGSWRSEEVVQIWDFASMKLIKSVNMPAKAKTQAYCTAWLGQQYILVAGSSENLAACIDRSSLNVSAVLSNLPGGVYSTSRHPSSKAHGNRFAITTDSFLVGLSVDV